MARHLYNIFNNSIMPNFLSSLKKLPICPPPFWLYFLVGLLSQTAWFTSMRLMGLKSFFARPKSLRQILFSICLSASFILISFQVLKAGNEDPEKYAGAIGIKSSSGFFALYMISYAIIYFISYHLSRNLVK